MDHCYTPLTSPSQKHPVPIEEIPAPDLEIDDLAHTLSILDGTDKPALVKTDVKVVRKVQKETKTNLQNDKVSLLNKVNKVGVNKVYKGVKTVLNKAKVNKKIVQDEFEDSEENFNNSDFEISDAPKSKVNRRTYKRRPKTLELVENDVKQKVKSRKGIKPPAKTLQKIEPKIEPILTPEPIKSPDNKKHPHKKDKKVIKPPIDDGIALFSTPDIIRRVGGSKSSEKQLENLESPKTHKPARIEDRSRSESSRNSIDSKPKVAQRLSLDSKLSHPEKIKPERRNSDKKSETISAIENALINIVEPHITPVFNDMSVKSQIEPVVPSVDEINAIIHTNNSLPVVDGAPINNQIGLEAPVLDIDHGILDNINTDELISEDILYQVAKLVENPDLQNAIDTTLVDANLLAPTLSEIENPVQSLATVPLIHVCIFIFLY